MKFIFNKVLFEKGPPPPPPILPSGLFNQVDPLAQLKENLKKTHNHIANNQKKAMKSGFENLPKRLEKIGIDPKKIKDFNETELQFSVKTPLDKIDKENDQTKKEQKIKNLKNTIEEMHASKIEKNAKESNKAKTTNKQITKVENKITSGIPIPPPPPPLMNNLFKTQATINKEKTITQAINAPTPKASKPEKPKLDFDAIKDKAKKLNSPERNKSIEEKIAENKNTARQSRRDAFESNLKQGNNKKSVNKEIKIKEPTELEKILARRREKSEGGLNLK